MTEQMDRVRTCRVSFAATTAAGRDHKWCPRCLDDQDREELLRLVGAGFLKIVRRPGEMPIFEPTKAGAEYFRSRSFSFTRT